MKKICVITTAHKPFDIRIYYKECLSLSKRYSVTIIAPGSENQRVDGMDIICVPEARNKIGRFLTGHRIFLMAMKQESDVYHFHDLDFVFYGNLLRIFKKKPVIFDVHEIYDLVIENRSWIPAPIKPLVRFLIKIINKVFVSKKMIKVVAAPYQLNNYPDAILLRNLPIKNMYKDILENKDYKHISYIGSITNSRVLNILSESMVLLGKDYKVTLVGKVHESVPMNVKGAFYEGFVSADKIGVIVGNAGIGVVPFVDNKQFHYSVPSKIFDYMALGMAIVAPSFIKDAIYDLDIKDYIYFTDGSPKGLADAIKVISNNESKYKKKSLSARKVFLEKYNWDKEEKKLLDLYEEITK